MDDLFMQRRDGLNRNRRLRRELVGHLRQAEELAHEPTLKKAIMTALILAERWNGLVTEEDEHGRSGVVQMVRRSPVVQE